MLHVLVLGAAAGGGFPQWNCNDDANRRVRVNDPDIRPRTQSSIAVSADGKRWIILNASPDLRQQINDNKALHPAAGDAKRASPISAVVVTNRAARYRALTAKLALIKNALRRCKDRELWIGAQ